MNAKPPDRAGRWLCVCLGNYASTRAKSAFAGHGDAVILGPIANDWAWLDDITGEVDEDFVKAATEQARQQNRPGLDFFK